MWFGMADGLIRYDGTNAYRYEHNPHDKSSLCHNSINVIVEDERQRLWIGTAFGLCIYDPEKDHFVNVDSLPSNKNHLNNSFITALSFDLKRKLWIGTHGGGVNIYDTEAHVFTYLHDAVVGKASSPRNYINSMLRVNDQMWCATKGGLKLFNTTKTVSVPLTFAGEGLPVRQLTQLVPDKAGNIWVASVYGEIFKLVPANGYYTVNQIFSGLNRFGASWNNIVALNIDRKGNLWIGGEHAGLNYLNTISGELTQYLAEEGNSAALPTNSIRSVFVDETGRTWIGTFDRGAYLMDNQAGKFNHVGYGAYKVTDLTGKRIRSFAEDRQGNVWLGIEGVGLASIDSKTRTLQKCTDINQQLTNKFVTALICDRNDNLWIGTGGHGVFKLNLDTRELTRYALQSGGFGDNKAYCLYEDKSGVIWAGSAGSGLFYFDETGKRFVVLSEQTKSNYITHTSYVSSVVEDSDGVLWIGTMYGLYALTKEHNHTYTYQWFIQTDARGGLSSSAIQSLYEDYKKNLWIGTTDNGLNVKVPGENTFRHYGKNDGLASNSVRAIVADAAGNLWVSSNTGLTKVDQSTRSFVNYSRKDGLSSNDFYPGACLRSSSGQLFFGNNNGFNAFYPDSIRNTGGKPRVYLADIKINNQTVGIGAPGSPLTKHISLTSEIELSYEQRSFIIDFVAIQFGPSVRHNYAYKLEGFDTDWHTGTDHVATYTNLDPGHYTFVAKASQSDGAWSEVPTQLKVTIRQAPWKTAWAISLYIALIVAVIFFVVKIRIDRVNMENQLALERLARQREHELIESKTQFFTNISHEFRTPLSLILMPLESLINSHHVPASVKERVNTAHKNANKMMWLVNELMDFNKIESGSLKLNPQHGELLEFIANVASLFNDVADKRNITFSVRTALTSLKGWFDRDKLERMLVNVLSNAFKFTADGGQITIIVNSIYTPVSQTIPVRCLQLVIMDNGIGMSSEELPRIFDKFYQAKSASKVTNPGTGIGLSLTKALVELHRGTITAESSPDKETKFVITLPIDSTVYNVEVSEEMPLDVVCSPEESFTKSRHFDAVEADCKDQYEILVVEDNEELREYIAAELSQEFKVWQARNGQEGARIALEKTPDLIVSDILMSQKNGIELCKEMKSNIKTSHIPFILLTARATVEDQIIGIESGADVYITKPFSVRFLLTHVRNLIDSRQKLYSHFSQDVYLMPSKVASNEIDQAFLQRAVDYIIEHIQDAQLGVDSIAELFSLSRVQVYRKIKALTGKTAVEFIRTVRLKQALKLMETKQYTLSEIAYLTGFNSASYFTRSFKDEYGKAPSEYLGMAS